MGERGVVRRSGVGTDAADASERGSEHVFVTLQPEPRPVTAIWTLTCSFASLERKLSIGKDRQKAEEEK